MQNRTHEYASKNMNIIMDDLSAVKTLSWLVLERAAGVVGEEKATSLNDFS